MPRRFQIINGYGALALILLLALLHCAREKPIEAIKVDLINAIPTGAKIVSFIDFGQGRGALSAQQAIDQNPLLKESVEKIKEKTNLDITQDIAAMAVGIYSLPESATPPEMQKPELLLVVKGKFDEEKIRTAITEQKECQLEKRKFRDHHYYQVRYEGDEFYFSIPEPGLAFATLFSGEGLIKKSLGHVYQIGSLAIDDKEFLEIRPDLDRTAQFWIMGQMPRELLAEQPGQQAQQPWAKIKVFCFYIKYFEGVTVKAALLCSDAEAAEQIKNTVSMFIDQMKMFFGMSPEMAELVKFLEKLQFKFENTKVFIILKMTEAELQQFQRQMEKLQQQLQPPPGLE